MKPKRSEKDSKGKLCVACCECKRGGNGDGTDNCSAGWRSKKWDYKSCFSGELLDKYDAGKL
jgi:hypothetical protein